MNAAHHRAMNAAYYGAMNAAYYGRDEHRAPHDGAVRSPA
jgi:hypothetical protein